jgi:hypothetical protein
MGVRGVCHFDSQSSCFFLNRHYQILQSVRRYLTTPHKYNFSSTYQHYQWWKWKYLQSLPQVLQCLHLKVDSYIRILIFRGRILDKWFVKCVYAVHKIFMIFSSKEGMDWFSVVVCFILWINYLDKQLKSFSNGLKWEECLRHLESDVLKVAIFSSVSTVSFMSLNVILVRQKPLHNKICNTHPF